MISPNQTISEFLTSLKLLSEDKSDFDIVAKHVKLFCTERLSHLPAEYVYKEQVIKYFNWLFEITVHELFVGSWVYEKQINALVRIIGRQKEIETYILNCNSEVAWIYWRKHAYGERWPALEKFVFDNPSKSVEYAVATKMGRWPEAEPAIMKSPFNAIRYTHLVIKDRWPEFEEYTIGILDLYNNNAYQPSNIEHSYAKAAIEYANIILNGRWNEVEKYFVKNSHRWTTYTQALGEELFK